jgi:hypothetical protein
VTDVFVLGNVTVKNRQKLGKFILFGLFVILENALGNFAEKDNPIIYLTIQGDQEGLFQLVILNFIFKCRYSWSNFRLLTASHASRIIDK